MQGEIVARSRSTTYLLPTPDNGGKIPPMGEVRQNDKSFRILDPGNSSCLLPLISDVIGYVMCELPVRMLPAVLGSLGFLFIHKGYQGGYIGEYQGIHKGIPTESPIMVVRP